MIARRLRLFGKACRNTIKTERNSSFCHEIQSVLSTPKKSCRIEIQAGKRSKTTREKGSKPPPANWLATARQLRIHSSMCVPAFTGGESWVYTRGEVSVSARRKSLGLPWLKLSNLPRTAANQRKNTNSLLFNITCARSCHLWGPPL